MLIQVDWGEREYVEIQRVGLVALNGGPRRRYLFGCVEDGVFSPRAFQSHYIRVVRGRNALIFLNSFFFLFRYFPPSLLIIFFIINFSFLLRDVLL